MFKPGLGELVIILIIILILFGAKRLPEIARSLAKAINEFKKTAKDVQDSTQNLENDNQEKK